MRDTDLIRVLVTGSGGGGIGEQIVKSLKNGRNDYFILCTDIRSPSLAEVIGDGFELLPPASSPEYLNSLLEISQINQIQFIFPGSEQELMILAQNRPIFEREGIHIPINDHDLIQLCSSKLEFNSFLRKNGFSFPETHDIVKLKELTFLKNYPYVLKPKRGSGSTNVFIVQNLKELNSILNYFESNEFILQQYVGTLDDEYTIGILSTRKEGYIDHITLRRDLSLALSIKQKVVNRTGDTSFGEFLGISSGLSQGKFVVEHRLDSVVERLIKMLKPISTINMQCRIWKDEVYIFEINPRFSGTTNLRALVGFNETEYLINSILGRENVSFNNEIWMNRTVLRGIKEYLIN